VGTAESGVCGGLFWSAAVESGVVGAVGAAPAATFRPVVVPFLRRVSAAFVAFWMSFCRLSTATMI
jgi:hypothetical protein